MRLTPEEIEARRFRLAPNGYDCEAVDRFLAEITEALREAPVATPGNDEFTRVGQEIASVLRAARDSAGAVKAEADGHAAATRSRAELEAADLRKEATAQLQQAQQAITDARHQAETLVREAEEHAAEIRQAERVARQRLLSTRTDLQALIDRLGGPTDRAVVDLTAPPPPPPAPPPSATEGSDAESGVREEADDPLLRMVRAAVGRAAEHSGAEPADVEPVDVEAQAAQQAPAV